MKDERNGITELWFFGMIVIGLGAAIWFTMRTPIMWFSFYSSFYSFKVYEYFPFLMTHNEYQEIILARRWIATIKPSNYGFGSLVQLFELHGYVWRSVVIPVMIWWGWKTRKSVVRFKYNREIKDIYALIEIQAKYFPASAIIRGKNILARHPYEGPWATYALPLDFALDNKVLWTSKTPISLDQPVDQKTMFPIPAFTLAEKVQPFPVKRKRMPHHRYVSMHVDKANDAFTAQLGPLWEGVDALPPLEKALFAAFCAQAAGKQKEAWSMIEQLAFTFKEGERDKSGKLTTPHFANTQGVQALLDKYFKTAKIQAAIDLHAYSYNVITAALAACRTKGRLMHSNFLWLKPVNRTLWYALCGQGGQSAYWEAAGPWAHGQIEELMGSKVVVPMVAGAVYALRDTMSREHWVDPGQYSEEAQKQIVRDANDKLNAEQDRTKNGGGKKQQSAADLYSLSKNTIPPKKTKENEED